MEGLIFGILRYRDCSTSHSRAFSYQRYFMLSTVSSAEAPAGYANKNKQTRRLLPCPARAFVFFLSASLPGGVLPYMCYIGMCRCEGYGFQAVYSRIGYINQSVWV